MKHRLLLILPLLFIGCSERPIDSSKLVKRNGIRYLIAKGGASDKPFHGTAIDYYEEGQLRERGTYKDGKQHGPWEAYHPNGQLEEKGTYKEDGEVVE